MSLSSLFGPTEGSKLPSTDMETDMAVGPVQLIVLGFPHPNFHGEVIAVEVGVGKSQHDELSGPTAMSVSMSVEGSLTSPQ